MPGQDNKRMQKSGTSARRYTAPDMCNDLTSFRVWHGLLCTRWWDTGSPCQRGADSCPVFKVINFKSLRSGCLYDSGYFLGFSIGIGITYPLCGVLISNLGWRSVFYTTGSIGVLWCLIWYLLAFDSPETHPRISLREQKYIRENTVNTYENSRWDTFRALILIFREFLIIPTFNLHLLHH